MTASLTTATRSAAAQRRLRRATAVVGATALNGLLWGVSSALGADFVLTDSTGTGIVTLPAALIFTALFGLLGWGTLALLERFTRHAPAIWTALAIAVTLLSIVPIFLEGATSATRAALTVLHLAVAAVLVPLFRRTIR
ncbi:MAG TPA: DUF6069 family protein [Pseudonocardia sp.]|uniref:DUF6069 family protein n=1 Tax=Pseudonocardia sp. TaxID=60912 RepID=UPI002C505D1B|nr:DUF6069 family protein [Pseudonocardia sp.]HTF49222.1 DUF6069 family protein [Pseudonocardia sp.]